MTFTSALLRIASLIFSLLEDKDRLALLGPRSTIALKAENLFLRKQLALYAERKVKPRRADDATRISLILLSKFFRWKEILTVVKPETPSWHRKAFRLFWRWKSRPRGRPQIPIDLRQLIIEMAGNNPTWGEERIAAELLLKLGIRVSPRTVRRYLPKGPQRGRSVPSQGWMTFVRNRAQAIVACDFFIAVTATFRILYVFVVMEIGRRRIIHLNVTANPTAEWTLQQFREVITGEQPYRFIIHDRDSIYSPGVDSTLRSSGLAVLKTPFRSPQANGIAERWVGSCRRDLLDHVIALNERHLKRLLREYISYHHEDRTHLGLGKETPGGRTHALPSGRIWSQPRLGGLHHRYDRAA